MARRAMNSSGVMTQWVLPRRGVFIMYAMQTQSVNSTC